MGGPGGGCSRPRSTGTDAKRTPPPKDKYLNERWTVLVCRPGSRHEDRLRVSRPNLPLERPLGREWVVWRDIAVHVHHRVHRYLSTCLHNSEVVARWGAVHRPYPESLSRAKCDPTSAGHHSVLPVTGASRPGSTAICQHQGADVLQTREGGPSVELHMRRAGAELTRWWDRTRCGSITQQADGGRPLQPSRFPGTGGRALPPSKRPA